MFGKIGLHLPNVGKTGAKLPNVGNGPFDRLLAVPPFRVAMPATRCGAENPGLAVRGKGGGHDRAAGCEYDGTIAEFEEKIVAEIAKQYS